MVSNTKELNPPISPADVAALDPAYWAQLRKIKLQAGEFSFVDREYQLEPMRSTAKRKVFMKATQMGFTEIAVLMTLHGMIYGHYLRGVMYIFPTEDNVQDFSRSRFGPLIDANRETIGRFVKSGGKGTDTVRLKKVRDAFLYLRGARASTTVGVGLEEKETVGLRSAPVDCLVYDELDLMGDAVIGQARGRIAASSKGHEIFLSNPIFAGIGVDALFQKSDKRYWHKRCACGRDVRIAECFPDAVTEGKDGKGYLRCVKCGQDLTRFKGFWIPEVKANCEYEGYHVTHLMAPWIDPLDVLRDFNDPPMGDISRIYRNRLGFPHANTKDQLQVESVIECCGQNVMPDHHAGPCAMGVDIGIVKHVVIGIRIGRDRYQIVKVAQVADLEEGEGRNMWCRVLR